MSNDAIAPTPAPFGLRHVVAIAGPAWLAAFAAAWALTTGAVRLGLCAGLVAGLFGAALGLVLLKSALAKPVIKPNDLMQVQVLGFLGRLLLVALGLVLTLKSGGDALWFAFGFFAPFFGVSLLEAIVVFKLRAGTTGPAEANGSQSDV